MARGERVGRKISRETTSPRPPPLRRKLPWRWWRRQLRDDLPERLIAGVIRDEAAQLPPVIALELRTRISHAALFDGMRREERVEEARVALPFLHEGLEELRDSLGIKTRVHHGDDGLRIGLDFGLTA